MAQAGDTITYTYGDGSSVSEDVSAVNKVVVDYIDGPGGAVDDDSWDEVAGSGGRVTNTVIDVSGASTLYIWVGGWHGQGRYYGGEDEESYSGGGSSEIALVNTDRSDSSDEPFLAGAGGGGGVRQGYLYSGGFVYYYGGGGGARDGPGGQNGGDASGTAEAGEGVDPPLGGEGNTNDGNTLSDGYDGYGAVESRAEIVDSGSTTQGGGAGSQTNGEIQLSYSTTSPGAPTNVHFNDTATEDELTIDWDEAAYAVGYYVYRAQASGSSTSDYTQVADVSSPPYTDTGLEDGEKYYYRVSSHD